MTDTFDNRLQRVPVYVSAPEDLPGPEPEAAPSWYSRAGNALLGVLDQFGVAGLPEGPRREAAKKARNRLLHIGPMEERDYLWPERMLRSGLTLAGDVATGNVPPPGLRREDYTDIPADPDKVGGTPHDDLIQRVQDMAGLAMSGGFAGTGERGMVVGSGATMPSTVRKGHETHVKFSELPPDMKVLIEDFVHGNGQSNKVIPEELPLVGVETKNLPKMEMDPFDRGESHARQMNLEETPPTIVANGHFMDGRHRAFKAKEEGIPELNAIDLSGLIDPRMQRNNTHGKILKSDNSTAAPVSALERAPVWYSPVEHALEQSTQGSATGAQWLATIRNSRGVKPEELDWTGLRQFLEERADKPVTRPELHEYLRDNRVELQDVTKGGKAVDTDALMDEAWVQADREMNQRFPGMRDSDPVGYDDRVMNRSHQILERLVDNAERSGSTKYHDYALPGGENYREHLITMPSNDVNAIARRIHERTGQNELNPVYEAARAEQQRTGRTEDYKSSHWDEPNIVAHVRSNVREMPRKNAAALLTEERVAKAAEFSGMSREEFLAMPVADQMRLALKPGERNLRSLHLEEVQSDWHQAGRRKGYAEPEKVKGIDAKLDKLTKEGNYDRAEYDRLIAERARAGGQTSVPDAPWKKTWHELALRRMIRLAAEEGMDRVSWTPGEAQAARYDLIKTVKRIHLSNMVHDEKGFLRGTLNAEVPGGGQGILNKAVTRDNIADVIGKEAAERLMNNPTRIEGKGHPSTETNILEGDGLKVGGEGMRGFYDKMMVQAAEKIGREYGVKVGKADDIGILKPHLVEQSEASGGGWAVRSSQGDDLGFFNKKSDAEAFMAKHQVPVWYFDVPPAMREAALRRGMPLFSGGKMFVPSGAPRSEESER